MSPDRLGLSTGRLWADFEYRSHPCANRSGRGDLVEPAGGAVVYEPTDLVLARDERAGLDARYRLTHILFQISERLQCKRWPKAGVRFDCVLHVVVAEGQHSTVCVVDLIDFPTLIWYETDYSVYTMRQASRRSWRIGQTRPVKVVFMSYRNSLQADALKLVAKKLQSSLAVEGELPEDGLAAYGDDGDDIMMALARQVISGEQDDAETVEAVFAQARDAEAVAEEMLVDDGWKAVEVNGNGHAANGVEPSFELVPGGNGHAEAVVNGNGKGHAAFPVNGNGHQDEAPEPQQLLFSWAEFMAEEPVKPKSRSRKPKPSSPSLFDWALTLEEEPVGAGR